MTSQQRKEGAQARNLSSTVPADRSLRQRSAAASGELLLTVFLKHRQSMNLTEINQKLEQTGFWRKFPPPGVEVVSWYVMMGIGQVVTLQLPAEKLREVNLALEQNAWGAFETEFYPTYDFRPVWDGIRGRAETPPAVT